MVSNSKRRNLRLDADTQTVAEIVEKVVRGQIRVPIFQRGLNWGAEDVTALFDSVYNNYPIGSFLFSQGPAEAARIRIGPLHVDAPETATALWVVDGQQRLTALTAGLARPMPVPVTPAPDDVWVVYFSPETYQFITPEKNENVASTWVPVAQLLDASALVEWVFNWKHGGDSQLRTAVFEAGTRIRQYQIPLYVVETDDEQLLRDIFHRVNNFGKSLDWPQVHDALFGRADGPPSTLGALGSELQQLGMGRPTDEQLLTCLLAFRGLDVTRNIAEHHRRDQEVLQRAVSEALPAIRRVLSFLKIHAEIPHLRLLPRSIPLVVLTRYFELFPEPKSRTLDLLTRWTWRTLLNTAYYDERTLLRHGVAVMEQGDEEGSVQRLLALVPHDRRAKFVLPTRFDARAAETRIALLGMASLRPINLEDGAPIDIAALIEEKDVAAFRKIIPSDELPARSPANRILLPGPGTASARGELINWRLENDAGLSVLWSHGISATAATALEHRDMQTFLRERKAALENAVAELGDRLAAWGASDRDRPSIEYLMQRGAEDI